MRRAWSGTSSRSPAWSTASCRAIPQRDRGWLRFGELPYEFRGDARRAADACRGGLRRRRTSSPRAEGVPRADERLDRYAAEQRRLIYVAVTRARGSLLLTGSFWSTQRQAPRPPGLFLRELADRPDRRGRCSRIAREHRATRWPEAESTGALAARSPRRARGPGRAAAAAVRAADPGARDAPGTHDIELLLAERDAGLRADVALRLPVAGPGVALQGLRRPTPQAVVRRCGARCPNGRTGRPGSAPGSTLGRGAVPRDGATPWSTSIALGADLVDAFAATTSFDDLDLDGRHE